MISRRTDASVAVNLCPFGARRTAGGRIPGMLGLTEATSKAGGEVAMAENRCER
jgi:hypothetical protein